MNTLEYTVDKEMNHVINTYINITQLTQCTLAKYIKVTSKTTIKINYLHFVVHLVTVTTPGIYIAPFFLRAQILEQPTAHSCEVN